MNHKAIAIQALQRQRGDDLDRCRKQFRNYNDEQMDQTYDLSSGLTRRQVLAQLEERDARFAAAIAWVESQPIDGGKVVAYRQWNSKWHDWQYQTSRGDLRSDTPVEERDARFAAAIAWVESQPIDGGKVVAYRQWNSKWHDWQRQRGDLRSDTPVEALTVVPNPGG